MVSVLLRGEDGEGWREGFPYSILIAKGFSTYILLNY